jgi:hypothetical protein
MKTRSLLLLVAALYIVVNPHILQAQVRQRNLSPSDDDELLSVMHSISSNTLFDYVIELASEKYQGRLTGTPGYNAAAQWAADLFKQWNLKPSGDEGTYFQKFPNPYTLVLESGQVILHIPVGGKDTIYKSYRYEDDFYPGSTSDSGTVTSEVVYVGYGITAPELNYDDYRDVDVKGKLVMMEPEIPISAGREPDVFKKWRPYSFHDYKMKNAFAHGVTGVVYNYHIVNPNCVYIKGLVLSYVGVNVINDIFKGTGKSRTELVQKIQKERKPVSFNTHKIVTITCVTEHHPEGIARNVIGVLEGTDPALKNEVIIIGAHLDHIGMNHLLMPGANDNASGSSVLLGTAEALSKMASSLKRTVLFILFGAEEQGVKGSEYYLAHPVLPNSNVKAFVNLESIGRGERLAVGAGKNYPQLWQVFERNDQKYIHLPIVADSTANLGRPRQDAAHFLWAGIPTIGIGTYGAKPVPVATYHTTQDKPQYITPEILEDIARLTFLSVIELAR